MRCLLAVWVSLGVGLATPASARADSAGSAPVRHGSTPAEDLPPGQALFRTFGGAEGLKNLVIFSIAQDADGLLWVGTDDGVYRFDGVRFTRFAVEQGLTSNLTLAIGSDPAGNLCVGSDNGLACWDGARFSRATTAGLPPLRIRAIASYGGKLWIGSEGGGLYVRGATGAFTRAPGWPGEPTATVRALWADAGGLVVGNGATVELLTDDGMWRNLGDAGLGSEPIIGVLRDRAGGLWIRSAMRMWHLPHGASQARDVSLGLPVSHESAAAAAVIALGPRGEVLVASDGGTAVRDGERWRLIDRAPGLPASGVRTLYVDREGTTWIGTTGLLQLRGRGLIERYTADGGLPGYIVWTIQRDREGGRWVGTNRCLAHAVAQRWGCVPATSGRIVRGVAFPPQGGMFVGGVPSDLLYVDDRGQPTSLGLLAGRDGTILALALGPDGALWIATSDGLFRLPHAVPGEIERVVVPGLLPAARFYSLAVVGDQLWTAAAPGGVAVLDRGAWHVFDARHGLRASAARYVLARAGGDICAAYHEAIGLSCFRYAHGEITALEHIGPAQGLTSGRVYFLGEDRQRRLWIGTGDGVDVRTPSGIDHFDESDGLVGNDSAATAVLLDDDGSLWLGASNGVSHVFAQHYTGPPVAPRIALLAGELGHRSIFDAAGLEVPHDSNSLSLEIAAGTMLDAKRVDYEMRLVPIEPAWSPLRERVARYPALPPGSYQFEARARIGAGPWGPTAQLAFAVLPAWWQARWFIALAATAGLAAIGAGFALRQRAVLQRRMHKVHAQSERSLRAVVDLMPDLISVHRGGQLVYLNRACRRLLGAGSEPADEFKDRIHPEDGDRVTELFRKVIGGETPEVPEVIEIRVRAGDGSWRTCEVSAVRVQSGGAPTTVMSGRDVTERKRERARMLVTDRMSSLGTLAAGIAHEINNPLSFVTGNLEVATEAMADPALAPSAVRAELLAVLNDARDGAERVRKIVHGLRAFSSAEEEHRVPLAPAQLLEAAIRLTANEIRHRARLEREFAPAPLVIADDSRLTQVFINLLVNAAHAIPEGHTDANRITVRTLTDDAGRAVIEIADTGHGMAPEVQARVFDPFFTTKDVGEGTGLGLAICHGIVTGLGGQISLDSAVGKGTTVRVALPGHAEVAVAAPIAVVEPAADAAPARRQRVMLVDDEPQVVQTMERLLRRDYDVTIALCGRDALDHITQGARFDAIVSDVMMPNMTGVELIEELQRLAPDQAQRLIFLSGGAFTAHTRERLDQIGAPQLAKPVTIKELRAWVTRVAAPADTRAA